MAGFEVGRRSQRVRFIHVGSIGVARLSESKEKRLVSEGRKKRGEDVLGTGLAPGANHYRAYVGPPEDYDLIAAMTFGLLTSLGLRQHHRILDVGCGSLRVGRLLIPYLNQHGYTGLDPNRWLVEDGIRQECGAAQVEIKSPRFVFGDNPTSLGADASFDFAFAQSIFSHAGLGQISMWLEGLAGRLGSAGVLIATFIEADSDHEEPGWVYPECVGYRRSTLSNLAERSGYSFRILDWRHPRQTWALFSREDFGLDWIDERGLSWNESVSAGRWD